MENYFEITATEFYKSGRLNDARPESGYQTGICPERVEKAKLHREIREKLIGNEVKI